MADIRTAITIPVNTWVKVLNGATSALLYKQKTTSDYMSLMFDAAETVSSPDNDPNLLYPLTATTNQSPATSQKIFLDGLIEEFSHSVNAYFWIACKSGKTGSVVVTT